MKKINKIIIPLFLIGGMALTGCNVKLPGFNKPEIVDQEEQKIREIYALAVANGFTGTYEEWLASIKGEPGDTPYIGNNGNWWIGSSDTGVNAHANDGKSAYEIYKEHHPEYTKSEEEWLDDLVNGRLANKESHTISFYAGEEFNIPSQQVLHGEKANKPEDVKKTGYHIAYWEYEGERWSFAGYTVTKDMTLNAVWEADDVTATVKFNVPDLKSYIVETKYNEEINLNVPELSNMKFDYWQLDDSTKIEMPYLITRNCEITGVYTNTININYDTDGGNPIESTKHVIGNTCTRLASPIKNESIFIGWEYDDKTPVTLPFEIPNKDITIHAVWTSVKDQFQYRILDNGDLAITGFNNTEKIAQIPDYINDKKVTTIEKDAFKDTQVEKIILGNNITTLEDHALENVTTLKEIKFNPYIIKYGKGTLIGCTSLNKIEISNNVKLIQLYDFNEELIPNDMTITINGENNNGQASDLLFGGIKSKLFNVILYNFKGLYGIPMYYLQNSPCVLRAKICFSGLVNVASVIFRDCHNLTFVTIEEGFVNIGTQVFMVDESIKAVSLPSTIRKIDECTFYENKSLQKIFFAGTKATWTENVAIDPDNNSYNESLMVYDTPVIDFISQ